LINLIVFVGLQKSGLNEVKYAYCMVPREIINGFDLVVKQNGDVRELTGNYLVDHLADQDPSRVVAHVEQQKEIDSKLVYPYRGVQRDPKILLLPVGFPRLQRSPRAFVTLFTYMFLHNDWNHLVYNMLFLFAFGPGLEALLGRLKYLFFYIASGLIAGLSTTLWTWQHYTLRSPAAFWPHVGASGAVAGIMGCFLILLPKHKVTVMHDIFGFDFGPITAKLGPTHKLPAWVVIGVWFWREVYEYVVNRKACFAPGTDHVGHIAGGLAGAALIIAEANITAIIIFYVFPIAWPFVRESLRRWWGD
jgi:membrane associated rhomboid family serine protease